MAQNGAAFSHQTSSDSNRNCDGPTELGIGSLVTDEEEHLSVDSKSSDLVDSSDEPEMVTAISELNMKLAIGANSSSRTGGLSGDMGNGLGDVELDISNSILHRVFGSSGAGTDSEKKNGLFVKNSKRKVIQFIILTNMIKTFIASKMNLM